MFKNMKQKCIIVLRENGKKLVLVLVSRPRRKRKINKKKMYKSKRTKRNEKNLPFVFLQFKLSTLWCVCFVLMRYRCIP